MISAWRIGFGVAVGIAAVAIFGFWAAAWANPAPGLVGDWEAVNPRNAFVMRVTWNQAAQRYEGVLVRHGAMTAQYGYATGELIWTAKPSPNPKMLEIDEESRAQVRGSAAGVRWVKAGVRLDAVTATGLTTSSRRYRRVVVNDGASPASSSSRETAAAPVAPGPGAPAVSPVRSAALAAFPTPDEVLRRVSGSDAIDTAARQAAAFVELGKIKSHWPRSRGTRPQDEQRESHEIERGYSMGQTDARARLNKLGGHANMNPYLDNEAFRRELLTKVFPELGSAVIAREDAAAAAKEAQAAAAAEQVRKQQEKEERERREEEEEKAAIATAEPDPAVKIGKARGTEMRIFGTIPIGAPIRTIETCADPPKKACVLSKGMTDLMTLATLGSMAPPRGAVILGPGKPIEWIRLIYGDVKKGVLVRVAASTEGDGRALAYLKKTYGAPTKTEPALEWTRPGLHIVYSPPTLAKMPQVAGRAPTYECVPGDPNCTGADELAANFWSALPAAMGAAGAMKAATAPNLVFETATVAAPAP